MTAHRLAVAAVALLALVPAAALADSLSCAGGIVSTGDSKVDLLGKCGTPTLQEASLEGLGRGGAPVERWSYDFGESRFVQVVTLVGGKVTGVERGSYGFAEGQPARARPRRATCDPAALAEGKLKLEIVARCGEPAAADGWEEEIRAVEKVEGHVVTAPLLVVRIDVWTYDFGPSQLLRFVRFQDGRVIAVETGSYGYSR